MSTEDPLEVFARELTKLVAAKGLSLHEVSARAGVRQATVGDVLLGRALPRRDVFRSLRQTIAQGDIGEEQFLEALYVRTQKDIGRRRINSMQGHRDPQQRELLPPPVAHRARRTGVSTAAPDPILYSTAAEFVEGLGAVHVWAEEPSLRELERLSQLGGRRRPRSTLSNMLRSEKLPKWDLAHDFLELCGVKDIETWNFAWRRIRTAERAARAAN